MERGKRIFTTLASSREALCPQKFSTGSEFRGWVMTLVSRLKSPRCVEVCIWQREHRTSDPHGPLFPHADRLATLLHAPPKALQVICKWKSIHIIFPTRHVQGGPFALTRKSMTPGCHVRALTHSPLHSFPCGLRAFRILRVLTSHLRHCT